jgi:hypothetical protein
MNSMKLKNVMVSSIEGHSGKSSMIIAMVSILREMGYEAGYFKPFGSSPTYYGGDIVDEDALNTIQVLEIDDEVKDVCPIVLEMPYVEFVNIANPEELRNVVRSSFNRIAENKDIVFVEGSIDYKIGSSVGLGDIAVSQLLDLSVMMVVKYSNDFVLDRVLAARELFGSRLQKVLFNKLSGYKRTYIESVAGALLMKSGMEIIGVIPRDPIIGGLFADEIREALHGNYLVSPRENMIIEQIIVGAMSPNSAIEYFRKSRNAALVTGGDRADLQVVALEVPNIKLIILTGNLKPSKFIIERAEAKGVPILLVSEDTLTTTETLDELFGKAKIRGKVKTNRVKELFESFVNIESLRKFIIPE